MRILSVMVLLNVLLFARAVHAMEHAVSDEQPLLNNSHQRDYGSNSLNDSPLKFLFFRINRFSEILPSEDDFGKTYLPYLHFLSPEIVAQNILPHLLNSPGVFTFYTGENGSAQDELEQLQKDFDNLNIQDNESKDYVILMLPKSLESNLKQLSKLTYKQKKKLAKNILKFVEYSSKPLASKCIPLIDEDILRPALVYILDHCNQEFRFLSNEEKDDYSLPELIERFKETFGFMSWAEKTATVNCFCCTDESALYERELAKKPEVLLFLIGLHVGPPLMAILPIPLGGLTSAMIGVTVGGIVLTILEVGGYLGCCGWCWVSHMNRVHDLDDALFDRT